jgi:hypothetical protein
MNLVKLLLITFPLSAFAEDALVKGLGSVFTFVFLGIIFVAIKFLISLFNKKDDEKK